jgi:hypothetical protein
MVSLPRGGDFVRVYHAPGERLQHVARHLERAVAEKARVRLFVSARSVFREVAQCLRFLASA